MFSPTHGTNALAMTAACPVTIYRFVVRGTIEEKILRLHEDKRDLATSLLEGSDTSGKLPMEDLIRLIREG